MEKTSETSSAEGMLTGGFGVTPPAREVFLVELANTNWLMCLRPDEMTDSWLLHQPVRVIIQQNANGGIGMAVAPYLYFIPKDSQKVGLVRIAKDQIMMMAPVSEIVSDGGRLESLYHGMFSSILRASSLRSVGLEPNSR